MATTVDEAYDADEIIALSGLEPVRLRPGMYVGSTGKAGHDHLLWEVVDNSVDEAMAGHATRVDVTLNPDGSATVSDDGRGIPVAAQKAGPYAGMPTVEMVLTVLHAGGKFEGKGYQVSGGLHGVGISVVNALSTWTRVHVRRDGANHRIEFGAVPDPERPGRVLAGVVTSPLKTSGRIPKSETGTSVTFLPDERVFSHSGWDLTAISRRLKQGAYLNPGLTFTLTDARVEGVEASTATYHSPRGLLDFIDEVGAERLAGLELVGRTDVLLPAEPISLGGEDPSAGSDWKLVMRWYPDQAYRVASFANGIETGHGGTHVKGYEQVLTTIMNRYARQDHIGLLGEKDPNLEAADVRSGLGVIVSVRLREPQFVGQTKDELSNDDVRVMLRSGFNEQFMGWMQDHPTEARAILTKVIEEMRIRQKIREYEEAERGKGEVRGLASRTAPLPTKLLEAESRNRAETELFIVEGDSAAAPAKKVRNVQTQAVLPIRGKGLNIENALHARDSAERIQANAEVQGILATLGAGSQDLFDLDALRYGKIIILTDADDDGAHIELLLITTFYRLARELVEAGRLYVARPPLFVVDVKDKKHFVADQEELEALSARTKGEMIITRCKGLGEMNYDELGATAIDPATRTVVRVVVEDASIADQTVTDLMGKNSEPKWRVLQDALITADVL